MLALQTPYFGAMTTIAQLVREARARKKWTQEYAAERMGVKRNWIAQIETDGIDLPRPEMLALIERHLGVSREEMLRAAGYLGPSLEINLMDEFMRIAAIDDLEDQIAELQRLPPAVYASVEAMAHLILRRTTRQG